MAKSPILGKASQARRASATDTEKVSNKITNEQLMEMFPEQIASGWPFIFFIAKTINENFVDVYLAQGREILRAQNVGTTAGGRGLSQLEIEMKGFDNSQVIRHRDVYNPEVLKAMGWGEEGVVLEGTHITVTDSLTPRDDVHGKSPRANTQGFVLMDPNTGSPIYRHTSLVAVPKEEEAPGDFVLDFEVSETLLEDWAEEYVAAEEAEEVEEG